MSKVVKLIEKNDTVLIDSITIITNSMFKGKEFYRYVSNDIFKWNIRNY